MTKARYFYVIQFHIDKTRTNRNRDTEINKKRFSPIVVRSDHKRERERESFVIVKEDNKKNVYL